MVVVGSVACLMIFKAWCRHHLGGPYASVVAVALLNLIIIIVLGEVCVYSDSIYLSMGNRGLKQR
jgi:hypothetical protein